MSTDDSRTPEERARNEAERTGRWPESWGPFHRHFVSDAIHRDGGPECDQPGTPRRVYVFDSDYLKKHEAFIARRTEQENAVTFESHRWYVVVRQGGRFLRAFAGGREFSGLGEFETEEDLERWRRGE
jgi:hypothetical protein